MAIVAETPGSEALSVIGRVFRVSDAEIGRLFGVSRQAVDQWRARGVPPARSADVDRVAEVARMLDGLFIADRIPQIVRTPGCGLGGRTVLDAIAASGAETVFEYIYWLAAFPNV